MSITDPGKRSPRREPASQRGTRFACDACGGRGYLVGDSFGIVGMVSDEGVAIRIPCIGCEQAPPPDGRMWK